MDEHDPGVDRLPGGSEADRLAVHEQTPFVGGDVAGENLHQRALARAVLTDHRDDLARRHVEVDPVERQHAGIPLDDVAGLEDHGCSGFAEGGPTITACRSSS